METRARKRAKHSERVIAVRAAYRGVEVSRSLPLVTAILRFLNARDWQSAGCVNSTFRDALNRDGQAMWFQESARLQRLTDTLHPPPPVLAGDRRTRARQQTYIVSSERRDLAQQLGFKQEVGQCFHCTELILPLFCPYGSACRGQHRTSDHEPWHQLLRDLFGGRDLCFACRTLPQFRVHWHWHVVRGVVSAVSSDRCPHRPCRLGAAAIATFPRRLLQDDAAGQHRSGLHAFVCTRGQDGKGACEVCNSARRT